MSAFGGCVHLGAGMHAATLIDSIAAHLDRPLTAPPRTSLFSGGGFVHRQSVTSPEDAFERQPTTCTASAFTVVFDGRLDNRTELISALDMAGDPASTPDSAIVLAAFSRWDAEAPAHLRGPFAVAAWDSASHRLILSRDAMAERPVYFHAGRRFLAFATTPAPLLALPGVTRAVSLDNLVNGLANLPADPRESVFEGIERVPAATTMVFDRGGTAASTTYWTYDWNRTIRLRRDDDYVEAAREQLDRAVARCLRLAGPVVTMQSGGLDSTAVTATAARLVSPDRVTAITLVPDERVPFHRAPTVITNEVALARLATAPYPNVASQVVTGALTAPSEDDERRAVGLGWPAFGLGHATWYRPLFHEAQRLGATAVLTGNAGNATFSWPGVPDLVDLLRCGYVVRVARESNALARRRGQSAAQAFGVTATRAWLPRRYWLAWVRRGGRPNPFQESIELLNPDLVRERRIEERLLEAGYHAAAGGRARRRLGAEVRLRSQTGTALLRAFHGFDTRHPFLDRDLVEFFTAVPAEQYLRGGITRFLARRVLADRLPADVIDNPLRGRQRPEFLHSLTLQRERLLDDLVALERSPSVSGVLNVRAMRRLADAWPADLSAAPYGEYASILERGIRVGRFLLAVEHGRF
jgi:asparagine synthase (glutamine-hydrolysing)